MVIYVYSDENTMPKYVGKAKCLKTRCKQHKRLGNPHYPM